MKKSLFSVALLSGVLFAQSNNLSNNTINTNGGNLNISQSNNKISKEEININKKIDNELLNIYDSNIKQNEKNYLVSLLGEAKKINQRQIPLKNKKEECISNVKLSAKILKFANIELGINLCGKIF